MLVRISDSQTLPSPFLEQSNHIFACCWHCSDFHGSWGPIPGCFSSWVLGSRAMAVLLSSRPFDTRSSNLLLAPLAGSFSCVAASPWFRVSRHATLLFLVVRWLCPPSRALDMPVSSLSRRLSVSARARLPRSFASSRLTASFSGRRRRPPRVTFALLCARLLVWSVPPAPSCGNSQATWLAGRSRWTCAKAVVYHNLVC